VRGFQKDGEVEEKAKKRGVGVKVGAIYKSEGSYKSRERRPKRGDVKGSIQRRM